jgi:hypothetical protein
MRLYRWEGPDSAPAFHEGDKGGGIKARFDLTGLHGEREYLRQGFLVDVDGDGVPELIVRTMNENRARAVRLTATDATSWSSRSGPTADRKGGSRWPRAAVSA